MNGNVTPKFGCSMAIISYQLFFFVVTVSENIIVSNKDTGTFMSSRSPCYSILKKPMLNCYHLPLRESLRCHVPIKQPKNPITCGILRVGYHYFLISSSTGVYIFFFANVLASDYLQENRQKERTVIKVTLPAVTIKKPVIVVGICW